MWSDNECHWKIITTSGGCGQFVVQFVVDYGSMRW